METFKISITRPEPRRRNYDVAVLGEMALTPAQVTMFSDWVAAGGNLVAMRPDKQLYGLMGVADASPAATLSNAYLQVDGTQAPAAGIVGQTIQFHGTADRVTLAGATAVATLYSNATTATANPAVTLRNVGGSGGQAVAFLFDLSRSVVYTRQGNPAWAGQERDGSAPMVLNGYGSYGSSSNATFSSNRVSLLDRGVVFAIAHIRGGGEMGKTWHDQGRMMKKKNTFTDFIAVAEHLIAQKYTARDRLVITGGSAGGLLMGAVVNMRPDLFKAVVAEVPFVDVINSMSDASLPLTVGEFEEWGNPKVKAEYEYMKSYCPYTNTTAKAYPTMLVKTSLNDSQVMYWEPMKWVAKLRAVKTDKNPLLFKINMGAGHGGSSGRYDALRELAFNYAFILGQFSIRS